MSQRRNAGVSKAVVWSLQKYAFFFHSKCVLFNIPMFPRYSTLTLVSQPQRKRSCDFYGNDKTCTCSQFVDYRSKRKSDIRNRSLHNSGNYTQDVDKKATRLCYFHLVSELEPNPGSSQAQLADLGAGSCRRLTKHIQQSILIRSEVDHTAKRMSLFGTLGKIARDRIELVTCSWQSPFSLLTTWHENHSCNNWCITCQNTHTVHRADSKTHDE